jgi:hypothetical protein
VECPGKALFLDCGRPTAQLMRDSLGGCSEEVVKPLLPCGMPALALLLITLACAPVGPVISTVPLDTAVVPSGMSDVAGRQYQLGSVLDTIDLVSAHYLYPDHPRTYVRGLRSGNQGETLIISPDSSGRIDFIQIRLPPPATYNSTVANAKAKVGPPSREWPDRRAEWRAGSRMLVVQSLPFGVSSRSPPQRVEILLWHCTRPCA